MSKILREISINNSDLHPTGKCVSCDKEMTVIDIATQAIHQPSAGMYCCQSCLPIKLDWYEQFNDGSITLK